MRGVAGGQFFPNDPPPKGASTATIIDAIVYMMENSMMAALNGRRDACMILDCQGYGMKNFNKQVLLLPQSDASVN